MENENLKWSLKMTTNVLFPAEAKFTLVSLHETEDEAIQAMNSMCQPGRYTVNHPLGGFTDQRFVTPEQNDSGSK